MVNPGTRGWMSVMSLLMVMMTSQAQQIQNQFYTVTAPDTVRPNTNYFAAISVEGTGGELQSVECRIFGTTATGQSIEIRESTRVPPGETQLVRLSVGEIGEGNYRFEAKGLSPISWSESTPLKYKHKGYSVFIQTDKAIYKPGNTVQFRAIVLSPQMKPSVTGAIDVRMTDGAGNMIHDWPRVFTTRGVWAAAVDIADKPVLGNWNISIDVNGQIFTKSFQVAEYVLPKFQVEVDVPSYATFKDTITATIKANYDLGRPVKGTATIAVFPKYKSGYLQPIFKEPYRQVIDISGKVDVEIPVARDLKLLDDYSKDVVFDVVVEEEKTGRRQNNTATTTLYKFPYKLELVKTADAFKPGMPYTCYLKLSYQDGKPVFDDLNPVSVKAGFGPDPSRYETSEYRISADGIIRLAYIAPEDPSLQVLGIEATYRDLSQWFSTVPRSVSSDNKYIQVRLATERPNVNGNIQFSIISTEPLSSFRYEVIGRGNIVQAATVRGSGKTRNQIYIQGLRDMSPRARIIVSYTRDTGEIVADAMDFDVEGFLSNNLDLQMSARTTLPGNTVDIEMRSKPNSFVGLLAIDKSVRALKAGHDIEKNDLLDEIKSYDVGQETSFYPWVQTIKNTEGNLYWYTGAASSKQVYQFSGVFLLSNGYLTNGEQADRETENTGEDRPIGRPIQAPDASTVKPDQGPGVIYETNTRPPLAGPYAFSRLPRPVDDLPKIYLKNDLPPTWLFTNSSTNAEGKGLMTIKVPTGRTNTSYALTGFAINQLDGMGITENMAELDLFQPFYVLTNLPHSVRVGETLAVEMVVFNYLSKEISAEVTLENPNGSGFIFGSPNPNEIDDGSLPTIELQRTKVVIIRPNGRTAVSFIITPQEIGILELKISASSPAGRDVLYEKLNVEAEGEIMYRSDSYFVDLTNKGEMDLNITVDIPKYAVPKSSKVFVSAVPDPVGPAINNLEDLLQFPTGCGEQNLAGLLPPAILMDYVNAVGRSSGGFSVRARKLMEQAYQRQLVFRHKDGSFSPFGKTDIYGTVWLTSQTAGALQRASKYIDIDPTVIDKALTWLSERQKSDGSYEELDDTSYHRIQANPVTLTAFTVLGFVENKYNLTSQYRNSMNKAIDYVASNWRSIQDPYDLSLVTYALHRAVHPDKDSAWKQLENQAQEKDNKKWWMSDIPELESKNPWHYAPNTETIEMTSYALLCLTERGGISDAVPVTSWLFSQMNTNGGFASTSDTYTALLALTEYGKGFEVQNRNTDMSIQYDYLNTVRRMKVSSEAATVMQKRILPGETREVGIRATGSGVSVIEVGYQYNLNVVAAWPSFVVNPSVTKVSDSNHMQVSVCSHFLVKSNDTGSNMAVMEVYMPSGFTVNKDSLPAIMNRDYREVKKIETERADTKVVIYFETIEKREKCLTIEAFRTHRVANQKPAPVVVYDYYDQSRRARSFYDVVPATLCDICEDDDCPDNGCPRQTSVPNFGSYAFNEAYYTADRGQAGHLTSSVGLVLSILTLYLVNLI